MKGLQNARSWGSGYTSHLPKIWKLPDPEDPDGCGRGTAIIKSARKGGKNLRKSEGLATPGKDLSLGEGVVREDTIPESAGETEQWGRESERTPGTQYRPLPKDRDAKLIVKILGPLVFMQGPAAAVGGGGVYMGVGSVVASENNCSPF